MKKIAVATEAGNVSGHFGHCQQFHIFDVDMEQNTVLNVVAHDTPGHRAGFLPSFIKGLGVNVIISGGMGGGAIDLFNENGIAVVLGAYGAAQTVVDAYVKGELVSTGSVCEEHANHGNCGGH
ncbi:dinitrogenase iron-molybdenum cofactor [Fusibacter sp. A1]|uniref:NifB/NifX family molybdenum-iron cluster-binding protein n=1 Tax=Fusibacter sp. A2 TaxID=2929473 RepID=UPI00101376B1|nr:dinitrogenase iron-molybdenum cofactor [Fusibacter sp. A1]RXV61160.1 dinitrogenase iron-molybdenum cofactor [Fusibacter sp. A1]